MVCLGSVLRRARKVHRDCVECARAARSHACEDVRVARTLAFAESQDLVEERWKSVTKSAT